MSAIAIDGPAGAGKSTIAKAIAGKLGFTYIDTGAMYRAVALCALEAGIDPEDADAAARLAETSDISIRDGSIYIGERDVTDAIRRPDVTAASARVAQHPGVREALVRLQRHMAGELDVVMEGRDIGTKVLPDAEVKVFLTASLDERATRRSLETDTDEDLETVKAAIAARDRSDMSRTESPLVQADDAVVVDSTGKTIDDVVDEVVRMVRAS